jgi:hypothetical protein
MSEESPGSEGALVSDLRQKPDWLARADYAIDQIGKPVKEKDERPEWMRVQSQSPNPPATKDEIAALADPHIQVLSEPLKDTGISPYEQAVRAGEMKGSVTGGPGMESYSVKDIRPESQPNQTYQAPGKGIESNPLKPLDKNEITTANERKRKEPGLVLIVNPDHYDDLPEPMMWEAPMVRLKPEDPKTAEETSQRRELPLVLGPINTQDKIIIAISNTRNAGYYTSYEGKLNPNIDQDLRRIYPDQNVVLLTRTSPQDVLNMRENGALIITDQEANDISTRFQELNKTTIELFRTEQRANLVEADWKRQVTANPELAKIDINWTLKNTNGTRQPATRWTPDGEIPINLPDIPIYINNLLVKVPTKDGIDYIWYDPANTLVNEKGGILNQLDTSAYQEELNNDSNNSGMDAVILKHRPGMQIVDADTLRNTFKTYGKVTEETLYWMNLKEAGRNSTGEKVSIEDIRKAINALKPRPIVVSNN